MLIVDGVPGGTFRTVRFRSTSLLYACLKHIIVENNLKNSIGFGSSEYTVIRCKNRVLPEWIYVWVTTDSFRNSGKLRMTGTGGLQRVPNDFISTHKIPVPDIKIQEDLINQIYMEEGFVESNRKLIHIYEQKTRDRIAKVWGE